MRFRVSLNMPSFAGLAGGNQLSARNVGLGPLLSNIHRVSFGAKTHPASLASLLTSLINSVMVPIPGKTDLRNSKRQHGWPSSEAPSPPPRGTQSCFPAGTRKAFATAWWSICLVRRSLCTALPPVDCGGGSLRRQWGLVLFFGIHRKLVWHLTRLSRRWRKRWA